ncbi:hypothetical protein PMAYCL1PPCAC_29435 [Pristionchus mayeri]|uniref:C2H2-type domain-containing protein n=1 Tax=Pristionchus mayeri TaxID=1317129 RepID=A0AAN5DAV0_9BILA|nr:hypothetical protein PMAYCL1PPCAC_29435 [Pristionchus mayeri]
MDGFSDRLDELYRSFSSLESRKQREKAVEELGVALQRMSATLDSPSDVLTEEATRIIAAEYGTCEWDAPSTSCLSAMDSSRYDVAHEMYEFSEALREEENWENGGRMSLLNYWKENSNVENSMMATTVDGIEEERRKRSIERANDEMEGAFYEKRIKLDELPLDEGVDREVELIECVICGEVLDSFHAYLSHVQFHVEGDENGEKKEEEKRREWRCAQCEYSAASRKTLWRHGRSTGHDWARKENDFSCEECDYAAGSKFNLERHRMRNHALPHQVECPLCFLMFPSIASFLSHHNSTHRGNHRRFRCERCSKEFTRKDKLIRHHKVVHESVRAFACPSCPSSFPSGWHLRRHLKSVSH